VARSILPETSLDAVERGCAPMGEKEEDRQKKGKEGSYLFRKKRKILWNKRDSRNTKEGSRI